MIIKVYGIYDDASHHVLTPFLYERTEESAIRNFTLAVQSPDSVFFASPSDFSLVHVCDIDDDSAVVVAPATGLVTRAASVIKAVVKE